MTWLYQATERELIRLGHLAPADRIENQLACLAYSPRWWAANEAANGHTREDELYAPAPPRAAPMRRPCWPSSLRRDGRRAEGGLIMELPAAREALLGALQTLAAAASPITLRRILH